MKYRNLNGGIFLLFVLVILLAGAVIAGDGKGEVAGRVEPASRQLPVDSEQRSQQSIMKERTAIQDNRASGLVNQASCIVDQASQGVPQSAIQNLSSTSIGDTKLDKAAFAQKTKKLQIPFVANNGQVDERVKFYAKTFGGTVFVTKDGEIVYALPNNSSDVETQCLASLMHSPNGIQDNRVSDIIHPASWIVDYDKSEFPNHKSPSLDPQNLNSQSKICNPQSKIRSVALKEEFVGARIKTTQGEEKSVTKVNYFKGNDPSKWKTNVSTYDMVNLGEIYKGIELNLKAYGDNVEKLFCVKPGADPEQIKISLSGIQPLKNPPPSSPSVRGTDDCPPLAGAGGGLGARGLWVNEEGQLVAETELGPVKFTKPVAYQEIDGKRVEVDVEYRIQKSEARSQIQDAGASGAGKHKTCNSKLMSTNPKSKIQNVSSTSIGDPQLEYGFKVAAYDKTRDIIIDPLLASTYLGGSSFDVSSSLAIDGSGNVYVTGRSGSSGFPTTTGAYDGFSNGNTDVFVSKFDKDLTSLLASTFLGGSDYDEGNSLAIDGSGNVYVTGRAGSSDFPTTTGAYDGSYNNDANYYDAFVSKFDKDLTSLLASTFLGGSGRDLGNSLAIDGSGNVYVTGYTEGGFPTTTGAYDGSYNGDDSDAFVSKFDKDLTSLLASTFLGGNREDDGFSLAIDGSGNVYVTGNAYSTDFPTTTGAYDGSYNGGYGDVFVSKFDKDLTSLIASTFLGGGGDYDDGISLAIDGSGNVYVTGRAGSSDFPTTTGAYDGSYNNDANYYDAFVSKFDKDLTNLLASTFLGGSDSDFGYSLAIDGSGNVYVTGGTYSSDFPTTTGAYDGTYNDDYDVFVSKFDKDLTSLLASTFLEGSSNERGYSLAIDGSGNVYVTGETDSSDFPTTTGAYDGTHTGVYDDVFVSKFDGNLSASPSPTPTATTSPPPFPTPVASPTPTPLPTPPPFPTLSPFPTPEGCSASSITTFPFSVVINKSNTYKDAITVWVLGDGGCLVPNAKVKAKLDKAGRKVLTVKPSNQKTNQLGVATFSIKTKKKAGNATITFSTQGAGFSITTIANVVVTE